MPAEGTAGCMSVLLCRRADWFQQMARCAMGLGPAGQSVSQLCSALGASGEAASSQDVLPFPCAGAGVSARIGSIELGPARDVTAHNGCRKGYGRRAFPRSRRVCVNERGGSIGPGHAASVNRARALQAGYPRGGTHRRKLGIRAGLVVSGNTLGRWSSSASGFWRQRARCVPFE